MDETMTRPGKHAAGIAVLLFALGGAVWFAIWARAYEREELKEIARAEEQIRLKGQADARLQVEAQIDRARDRLRVAEEQLKEAKERLKQYDAAPSGTGAKSEWERRAEDQRLVDDVECKRREVETTRYKLDELEEQLEFMTRSMRR